MEENVFMEVEDKVVATAEEEAATKGNNEEMTSAETKKAAQEGTKELEILSGRLRQGRYHLPISLNSAKAN
jgi:hypothetical protein